MVQTPARARRLHAARAHLPSARAAQAPRVRAAHAASNRASACPRRPLAMGGYLRRAQPRAISPLAMAPQMDLFSSSAHGEERQRDQRRCWVDTRLELSRVLNKSSRSPPSQAMVLIRALPVHQQAPGRRDVAHAAGALAGVPHSPEAAWRARAARHPGPARENRARDGRLGAPEASDRRGLLMWEKFMLINLAAGLAGQLENLRSPSARSILDVGMPH